MFVFKKMCAFLVAAAVGAASQDAMARSFVSWDLKASVEYNDGSTKRVATRGVSYSSSDVQAAAIDAIAFAVSKIKQEAIFPCTIIDGPYGPVRVGNVPNQERSVSHLSEVRISSNADGEWYGTASAECVCDDDRCVVVRCSIDGEASYTDVKSKLEAGIKTRIEALNGKLKGSISFSIRKRF